MSTRRIEALRALAERGATEGERKAAREALGKHQPAQAAPPDPTVGDPYHRARNRNNYWDPWQNVPRPTVTFEHARSWAGVRSYATPRTAPSPEPPRPEPEAEAPQPECTCTAVADPHDPNRVRVEVSTNAEMWRRYQGEVTAGLVFAWGGKVVKAKRWRGLVHDRTLGRFYLVASMQDLVPA